MPQPENSSALDTKMFRGGYHLHKSTTPRRRHPSFEAAEAEAQRLTAATGETFVITQEVGRVKRQEASGLLPKLFVAPAPEPRKPNDNDPPEVFEAHAAWVGQQEGGSDG